MKSTIMFYINTIGFGGAERVIVQVANYMANVGYHVVFVTSLHRKDEYELNDSIERINIEEQLETSRIKKNVNRILALRKYCKLYRPKILVSFMAEANFRAIAATRGLNVKTLVSVRNDPNREYAGKLGRFVGKVLLPLADGCVFQTEEARKWFPIKMQRKSRIIYNAVKEEFYHVERKLVRGEIVTCGRLVSQKNHAMLINAFAEVAKEYPFATLKIYGEGPLREELQGLINKLDIEDKAILMGTTNDVGKVLETADLFVLSSDYEGMPNALMEAMAAGVPCISTDCPCGGPRMLIKNEVNGMLVPPQNEEILVEMLKKLIIHPEYAAQLGKNAKNDAKGYAPDVVRNIWREYIESIIRA